MHTSALVCALAALVLPAAARLQFQRLPPATGDGRFQLRSTFALAQEGIILPILHNDGNLVGVGMQTWARSGDLLGDQVFGAYVDKDGMPIDTPNPVNGGSSVSHNPDFTSVMSFGEKVTIQYDQHYEYTESTVSGPFTIDVEANVLYSITQFEYALPATTYLTKLYQETVNGSISAVSTKVVSFSAYNGLLLPCAGSVTPWNTHIGGEETDPDARKYTSAALMSGTFATDGIVTAITKYMGVGNTGPEQAAVFNPYNYGHIFEITVDTATEEGSAVKHFALGRGAWEMGLVMPDRRTVYLMQDRSNGSPLLYFKADTADSLASGSLYAGRVRQAAGTANTAARDIDFRISWVLMGSASGADIEQMVADGIQFSDIFNYAAPNLAQLNSGTQCTSANTCPPGFVLVPGATGSSPECLQLTSPEMSTAATFLETTRYAAYVGGTVEFTKMEGVTYDSKRNALHIALTNVDKPMLDVVNDGTANAIKLLQNVCGCVVSLKLSARYVGTKMTSLVCGQTNKKFTPNAYISKAPLSYKVAGQTALFGAGAPAPGSPRFPVSYPTSDAFAYNSAEDLDLNLNNVCDLASISGPDNLAYVPGHDGLVIGEDTDYHQNDMLWYYDFEVAAMRRVPGEQRKTPLTRIFTAPFGSELTSTSWYPDLNGWSYMINVIQHPYGEDMAERVNEEAADGYEGYVGYIAHNLAIEYYNEVGIVGGLPRHGDLCPQGTAPDYEACNDLDPCTKDECVNTDNEYFWRCRHTAIEPCTLCASTEECDDGSACTFDQCIWGQGMPPNVPGAGTVGACQALEGDDACVACTAANRTVACNDGNSCTHDRCLDAFGDNVVTGYGVCTNEQPYGAAFSGCATCTEENAATVCDNGNTCQKLGCDIAPSGGICINTPVPGAKPTGCALCTEEDFATACDDQDDCTEDVCEQGVCVNIPLSTCEPCLVDPVTGVSTFCAPLDQAYPYDSSKPASWPFNFEQTEEANFNTPPYCAKAQCIRKKCTPQVDPACCGTECNQCGPYAFPSPITTPCTQILPALQCKVATCVGSSCQYVDLPNGSTCRIGGANKVCADGVCQP